jgi:serine/threonine-protein kinase RsbW
LEAVDLTSRTAACSRLHAQDALATRFRSLLGLSPADWSWMQKRRILIVDNNDELRAILEAALGGLGHEAVVTGDRDEALNRDDLDQFDLIISDLTVDAQPSDEARGQAMDKLPHRHLLTPVTSNAAGPVIVKAFKMVAANYLRLPYNRDELREIVEKTLSYKLRYVDDPSLLSHTHEKIEFELPSDVALMNGVLQYLLERVAKMGHISIEGSHLFVALDEAFINAVKHGNKNDPTKLVRVGAELSPKEACFTIEDEGPGFDVETIPDPRDPANLFKSSGRGVLLMYNIMDEVEYNAQGNRVKMVKRPAPSVETQLVEPGTPNDKHAGNV